MQTENVESVSQKSDGSGEVLQKLSEQIEVYTLTRVSDGLRSVLMGLYVNHKINGSKPDRTLLALAIRAGFNRAAQTCDPDAEPIKALADRFKGYYVRHDSMMYRGYSWALDIAEAIAYPTESRGFKSLFWLFIYLEKFVDPTDDRELKWFFGELDDAIGKAVGGGRVEAAEWLKTEQLPFSG